MAKCGGETVKESTSGLLAKARTDFKDTLKGEKYSHDELTRGFTSLESYAGQAIGEGLLTTQEHIQEMLDASIRGKELSERHGDLATMGYFVSKVQTYNVLANTLAAPTEAPVPQQTDTTQQQMAGAKHRIN